MAAAAITYAFSDGDALTCLVEVAGEYPDALDEARTQATRLFSDALGVSIATLAEDADP